MKPYLPHWLIPNPNVCPRCDRLEPDHYVFECPGHVMSLETRIRRAWTFRIWWLLNCDLSQMPQEWCN